MYETLIEALRKVDEYDSGYAKLMYDAADAIEGLQKKYDGAVSDNKSLCRQIAEIAKERNEAYSKGLLEGSIAQRAEDEKWMPKWIPVTEKLPEPNAVDKYGFAKGYLVKTDRRVMMHTARYTGKWWILWGTAEVITDTVTHWMTLPELPKEETC